MSGCKSKSFFKKTCFFTNTALKKAQNFIEVSQLNLKISSLKSKMERKCSLIGALVVSKKNGCLKKLSAEQCDEKIDKLCDNIEKLRNKIRKLKGEVKEIKQHMKNCSFCSYDCNDDEDDFDDEGFCESCDHESDESSGCSKLEQNSEKTNSVSDADF